MHISAAWPAAEIPALMCIFAVWQAEWTALVCRSAATGPSQAALPCISGASGAVGRSSGADLAALHRRPDRGHDVVRMAQHDCGDVEDRPPGLVQVVQPQPVALELLAQDVPRAVVLDGEAPLR